MFFKMLKNDLKCKKGLNIIIFLFIAVASVLVFAGSVQIYSNIARSSTARTMCRPSDLLLGVVRGFSDDEDDYKNAEPIFDSCDNITEWSRFRMMRIKSASIDYPNYDEEKNPPNTGACFLTPLPREFDLVYDLNDRPFYVPNGCIALSVDTYQKTGAGIGDKIRLTTDTGKVYELEVSNIFKDNSISFVKRFIVSDADYELLASECAGSDIVYGVRMKDNNYSKVEELFRELEDSEESTGGFYGIADSYTMSDDFMMMEIISVFVIITSIFLIAIIFMTIRFTMVAEMKNEEKEIGMMKALGVDSLRFRWMFAAKYIAFAIVGGIIGIAAGLPLSGMVVNMFGPDCILPERWQMILIGVISVLLTILIMILFSLLVMRRINRISVIDAIHGENRGERFGRGTPMFLHRRKRMSVPLFLGISDVLGRFRRYIFLMIAYTLGAAIVLLVFNVRNSCVSVEYMKTWLTHTLDFNLDLPNDIEDDIDKEVSRTGSGFYDVLNKRFADNGIPAHVEYFWQTDGVFEHNGDKVRFGVLWHEGQPEKFDYRKGGKAPKLANEAAMSAFTANNLGIKPGDVIKVTITEDNEDHTGYDENERELVITGLFDYMENGFPALIMGDDYNTGSHYTDNWTGWVIDAPKSQHPAVIKQLRDLFGDEAVMDQHQAVINQMDDYDRLFATLEKVMTAVVVFVLILITYLYVNIFISEEASETALLKSMGFRGGTVRKAYLIRMALLAVISVVIGEVIIWTLGSKFFNLFLKQYEATGMKFFFEFPVSFVLIPLLIIGTVELTAWLTSRGVRNIEIWKISEE